MVDDLDLGRTRIGPPEADAPLPVDPYRMLTRPVAAQCFEAVAGRHAQVGQSMGGMKQLQLPPRLPFERTEPPYRAILEQGLRICIGERYDHGRC